MKHQVRDCPKRAKLSQTTATVRGRDQSHGGNETPMGQRKVAHIVVAPIESGGPIHVYAVKELHNHETIDMIACTFIMRSFSLFLLVYLGSIHSYIESDLVCELGIRLCDC
ncbi:hypothetical protein ES332_D08G096900v1 [Gossypium tomentosum]|uniref:Uncharacterized protein n=1 Tax=Gossypium tomentosum TaxID=34277 RepID=A0A5D2JST0_GOSTO|nr:hypothetical protein ES332_D08G096900v1 [Gossypium tomentosum]